MIRIGQHLTTALGLGLLSFACISCESSPSSSVATAPNRAMLEAKPPAPAALVHQMSEYLRNASHVSFRSVVTYDTVQSSGRMIQYGGTTDAWIRRPDRLHTDYRGDERSTQMFFDGTTFVGLDVEKQLYAVAEVGPEVDDMLDFVYETYGITVPIADFIYADPFDALMPGSTDGIWVGLHELDGRDCHHLAFAKDTIDWQIWIEAGPRPLPRKILITYKTEEGAPQWAARFVEWNLNAKLPDRMFQFEAPEGATRMDFLPIEMPEISE